MLILPVLLVGMGFGLIVLPSTVILTSYFDKRRAFATSISACGADVGTFTFATILHFLDDNFGWEYTVMILGGLVLFCIPLGILLKPFKSGKTDVSIGEKDMEFAVGCEDVCDSGNINSGKLPTKYHTIFSSLYMQGKNYLNLFLDMKFSLFVMSNFLTCLGVVMPVIYTVVSINREEYIVVGL